MNSNRKSLKPRKTPVQARSTVTVAAIFEGCIQVLLDGGLERLTTTRVALRAGVSVGTLYQYYPNKESLLSAVLEAHLLTVVEAVEAACVDAKCGPVAAMAQAAVNAFVDAKLAQPATSRALYAVAADVGGSVVVARLTQRAQLTLCDMLATASDAHFSDLGLASYMLATSIVGPVQGMLASDIGAVMEAAVREQLVVMTTAYLKQVSQARVTAAASESGRVKAPTALKSTRRQVAIAPVRKNHAR